MKVMDINEAVKQETEGTLAPLHKVTPLSKYLAMALFVLLPFIGGWIGYMYAPEKVVEVERVVKVETSKQIETVSVSNKAHELPQTTGVETVTTTAPTFFVRDGETFSSSSDSYGVEVIGDVPDGVFEILPIFMESDDSRLITAERFVTLSIDPDTVYQLSIMEMGSGWMHLKRLKDSDAASFRRAIQPEETLESQRYFNPYVLDASQVYYKSILLPGVNPNNFTVEMIDLGDNGGVQYFGNDGGQYYYRDIRIANNDLDSVVVFEHPGESQKTKYVMDAASVYFIGYENIQDYDREAVMLVGAYPSTFNVKEIVLGDQQGTLYLGMSDSAVWADAEKLKLSPPDLLFYYDNTIVSDGQSAYFIPITYRPTPKWICEIEVEDIHVQASWTCGN